MKTDNRATEYKTLGIKTQPTKNKNKVIKRRGKCTKLISMQFLSFIAADSACVCVCGGGGVCVCGGGGVWGGGGEGVAE